MDKRVLNPDDLYQIKTVGAAELSPDGKLVAYVVQRIDKDKDRGFTDIYLAEVETGKVRRLTSSGKDSSPSFSPDGKCLAFVSSRSEKGQIYILDLSGGEAWCIPTEEAVSGALVWFPDGKQIAYISDVFSKPEDWVPYPGAPEWDRQRMQDNAKRKPGKKDNEDKQRNEVKVITRLRFRIDGAGYFGETRRQVFVTAVPDAAPLGDLKAQSRQVTSGDYDHGSPTISPCGRYLVSSVRRSETADYDLKSDLWLYEVESGKEHLLYDAPGPASNPLWMPGGNYIAFAGHDSSFNVSTTTDLLLLDISCFIHALLAGNEPAPLSAEHAINVTRPFDLPYGAHTGSELRYGSGHSAFWVGAELHFMMSHRGAGGVYKTDTCGKVTPILVDEHRAITSAHGNGQVLVFTASQVDTLENLYVLDAQGERPLFHLNDEFISGTSLGKWERMTYPSTDDQQIDGWIIYPVDYEAGKQYPLLLLIHGGPHGAYGPGFTFLGQIFAGQGYVVLYTNPRGSTSYSQAFTTAIDKNWGVVDYQDIMAGVDQMLERGLVDQDRMFVHGWSFGGYMTCWLVTQTNRFRAACGGANVTNLLSDYGTADIMWADEYEYGGQPWKDAEHLLAHSPISHVENVETPILLMHGESDLRVPPGQTEEFYTALRRLGKHAVMVRYPGEFHGPRRPVHRIDRYERLLSWFDYYRKQ